MNVAIGAVIVALISATIGALVTRAGIGSDVKALAASLTVELRTLNERLAGYDSELAGFAPLGSKLDAIKTGLVQIERVIEEHRRQPGHQETLIRLARIEDRADQLRRDVDALAHKLREGDRE